MRTLAGPDRIAKFFSASDLKEFHVNMSTCWTVTKIEGKRFPYKCLSSPPKNHFKICPFSKWKEAWILQPWHHSGLQYNRSRDPTMCSLQGPHSPILLSSLFIVFKETFVYMVVNCLFSLESYLCIWYVREGKIRVNLDVAWLKGNMKMFFKKRFLAWFINPVSVELQLTLETKFEWAISNLSGNNGKNGWVISPKNCSWVRSNFSVKISTKPQSLKILKNLKSQLLFLTKLRLQDIDQKSPSKSNSASKPQSNVSISFWT